MILAIDKSIGITEFIEDVLEREDRQEKAHYIQTQLDSNTSGYSLFAHFYLFIIHVLSE